MLKLNIGAGPVPISGWKNVDLYPFPGVDFMNAAAPFPYLDETFDRIFTEHMIEHVSYADGRNMLAECYRVLKPGGRIRISTPNLGFLVSLLGRASDIERRYIEWACANFTPDQPPFPENVVNNFVRAWGHQYIYSTRTLDRAVQDAGFSPVRWCSVGESNDPELAGLENVGRMPEGFLQLETMTIEADKFGA